MITIDYLDAEHYVAYLHENCPDGGYQAVFVATTVGEVISEVLDRFPNDNQVILSDNALLLFSLESTILGHKHNELFDRWLLNASAVNPHYPLKNKGVE